MILKYNQYSINKIRSPPPTFNNTGPYPSRSGLSLPLSPSSALSSTWETPSRLSFSTPLPPSSAFSSAWETPSAIRFGFGVSISSSISLYFTVIRGDGIIVIILHISLDVPVSGGVAVGRGFFPGSGGGFGGGGVGVRDCGAQDGGGYEGEDEEGSHG
ncbi:hypothetical protein DM02DRAFT_179294 [Periconia macrospinosa]|uniref:Uncharacterized protein n=1 Tax=Periconia macrospinosa TaxID=97972 RepID=A0A2V1E2R6_9PLEO|nr:hypothetical protein DM02DRAFT_179294 [Periconia macrospinosa]